MSVVTGSLAGCPVCAELALPTNVRASNYASVKRCTREKKLIGEKISVVSGSSAGRPVCAEFAFPNNVRATKYARGERCARRKIHVAKDAHRDPRHALAREAR